MLLAEIEIRHSRAVAPTRRVALGPHWLPTEPSPGYGGILLGGIVVAHLGDVDPELRDEFLVLVDDLEADYLARIELVEGLEEDLSERSVGFRIEDEDLVDLKTVRDAVDYVYGRVKGS